MPTRLGRYTLLGKLAQGGMAELFLAKSEGIEGFEKIVVLKRILPSFAEDEEFIELFVSEARLAAQLDHANIVHVHDIGRDGTDFFFTMEYLHGHDVRHLLNEARRREHRLPLKFVLAIVAGAAAGLHHAHKQVDFSGRPLGIVHRDISPSNIIITYSGHVKMVDFGIAKAAALSRASRASSLKGKVAYMSPEQCKGDKVDCRSDVFALGLVMQELLTNRPVFGELDHIQAIHAVAAGEVTPIQELWPECPPGLAAILGRALEPEPEQRYGSAIELQRDLERFAHEHRLMLSSAELGEFLEAVFGTKKFPWLEPGAPADPSEVGLRSVASATVDKRREAGLAGGTRVATMLAPELEPEPAPEPVQESEPARSDTFVAKGSETSIQRAPPPSAEEPRGGTWRRLVGGAAITAGFAGALWAGGMLASDSAPSAASPAAPSGSRDRPVDEPRAAEPGVVVTPQPNPAAAAAVTAEPAVMEAPSPSAEPDDVVLLLEPDEPAPEPEPVAEPEPKPRKKPRPKSKPKAAPKPSPDSKPKSDPNGLLPY